MGWLDLIANRVLESRDIKRNPNAYSLEQLRKLYPDQEVADQSILRGIEQEQQRINPNFRMPRETAPGTGVAPSSPFTTKLAPGEDSSVSDALVNRYMTDAPIKPIRPPSREMWTIGEDGIPRPTGKSIPEKAQVFKNPKIEMMRELMEDAAKKETTFGYQSELEEYRQGRQDDRALLQERGRNARTKDTKVKTHLWHNPETGQMEFVSEDDVNSGKYQGWKPYNTKQSDDGFLDDMKKAAGEGGGARKPAQSAPQLDEAKAREILKKAGYGW